MTFTSIWVDIDILEYTFNEKNHINTQEFDLQGLNSCYILEIFCNIIEGTTRDAIMEAVILPI